MDGIGALKSTTLASLDLGGNELGAASLLPICAAYKAASAECRLESLELFGNNHDENGEPSDISYRSECCRDAIHRTDASALH